MKSSIQTEKNITRKRDHINRFFFQLNRSLPFDPEEYDQFFQCSLDYFNEKILDSFQLEEVQDGQVENINYSVCKEYRTNAWFFMCDKLIILHIKPNVYDDFVFCQNTLDYYTYVVYKSPSYYIVFCTSHTTDQVNLAKFLVDNNCEVRYAIMSCVFKPFVMMNNSYNKSLTQKKYKLEYVEKIGSKDGHKHLETLVRTAVSFVNNAAHLPVNYLNI